MLIRTIRPTETRTLDVEADPLAGTHKALDAACPPRFEVTDAPVRTSNGTTTTTASRTSSRRDGARDIEAADVAGLRAQVPGGWVLLQVRSA